MVISWLKKKGKDLLLTERIKMKVFTVIIVVLMALLASRCTYKLENDIAPKNLIPKDSFAMILQDVMVVESYYKMKNPDVRSFYKTLPSAIDTIFKKYTIDSLRYNESMNYYSMQQEELLEIYKTIQDSLILNTAKFEVK